MVFLKENRLDWRTAFGLGRPGTWLMPLISMGVAAAVLPAALVLADVSAWLLSQLEQPPVEQAAVQALRSMESPVSQLGFGFVAVFLAPVVEELIFRRILYPTVRQYTGRALALCATSLLFAASHANLVTFIPLTFLAVVLTWLYEATDNLLAPMATHCLFNLANYLYILWQASTNSNGSHSG